MIALNIETFLLLITVAFATGWVIGLKYKKKKKKDN